MATQYKKFSIIVPTFRRPSHLSECLGSMMALEYPPGEFEVIVVDDGSESPPRDIVASYKEQLEVRLIEQRHSGPAAARNRGAKEARGVYLAFTDDDCKPSPDWLQKIENIFDAHPKCVIAGRAVNVLNENPYSEASQILCDYLHSYHNRDNTAFLTSNNMAVPRELFTEIGWFDTSFPLAAGEDREFCDRAVHLGYETIYSNDVAVRHAHKLTFRKFLTQHYNYGKGAHRFHRLRYINYSEEFKLEPLSFYAELIAYPWKISSNRKFQLAFLLFVSQIANAAGFFREKLKRTTA